MVSQNFHSVLVANRGEIAVRIIRTVEALGLTPMIVYHAADKDTPAVRQAAITIEINGATPVAAYLASRGIDLGELGRVPRALRFHPACWCSEAAQKLHK